MATNCLQMELSDADLNELANIMGHDVEIHKKYYRKNIPARHIAFMIKYLGKAVSEEDEIDNSTSGKA